MRLPVIDLAPFLSGDARGERQVADALRAACADSGFFYLTGHGIAPERLDAVLAATRALFALPAADKRAIAGDGTPGARGHAVMGGRAADLPHDALKEEYYLGRGANRWPETLPAFRAVLEPYVEDLHGLSARLMAAMAVSLDLPRDRFAAFCTDPVAALRLVRYGPCAAGAAPHTDFGSLTLLLQDDVGGLEVQAGGEGDGDGWIAAPPLAGSFVVNVGDLFERWTNGRYRSTRHRVVNHAGVERFSAPFFLTGAADHPVAALASCIAAGEAPRFPPTTVAAHLAARFAGQGL